MSTKYERAHARYLKLKAIRDIRKRQWQQAERDLTAASDALYQLIDIDGLIGIDELPK